MKKLIFLLAACCLLFSLPPALHAQKLQDPTTWTYEVRKTGTNEYDLVFHVALKQGWHIFSQQPGDEFIIPPSFAFSRTTAKLVGKPQERGNMKIERIEGIDNPVNYYEGKVDFIQKIKARPGTKVSGEHEYQVCNENMCLPPVKKHFVFEVKE